MAIVIAVTGLHAAALALLLSQISKLRQDPAPLALIIELAELEPARDPPPEPKPETEPEPERSNPQRMVAPRPVVADTSQPVAQVEIAPQIPVPATLSQGNPQEIIASDPEPQTLAETDSRDVLTQIEMDLLGVQTATARIGQDGDGEVSAGQIASVLQRAECLNLKRRDESTCPPEDPFEIALAIQERGVPPERLAADPRYVSLSVSDKIFQREAANRFHWPDADMFEDPMAPGAYNAQRIRNGQEPLWSQEMHGGFRKEE